MAHRLTVAKVKEALQAAGGIKTVAARSLNCHRATLYRFLAAHPTVAEFLEDIDEEIKDLAEGKLLQLIKAGDGQAIRFYLERKARDRGYGHKVEATGPNGGPIEVAQKLDLSGLSDEDLAVMIRAEEIKAGIARVQTHRAGNPNCTCETCAPWRKRAA